MSDEIVHRTPYPRTSRTPCCNRSPFDLPLTDRLTNDDALVTCAAPPDPKETQ